MKRIVCLIAATLLLPAIALQARQSTPKAGEPFPEIRLPMPEDPAQRAYLGLSGSQPFSVQNIRAEVLVIEIFNMYCPHCQREAPQVNAFYRQIEMSPALRGRVKLIGIGVGNSPFEVDHFRSHYQVPFPLFPDADYAIHQRLGEVRTPYFFGLKLGRSEAGRVFFSKLGGPSGAAKLLETLIRQSGLTTEGGEP